MFYKEIKEQTGPGSALLEHLTLTLVMHRVAEFHKFQYILFQFLFWFRFRKFFWNCWDTKYCWILTKKRQRTVSINRALSCKKDMACDHLDDPSQELITTGIITNHLKTKNGVWNVTIDTSKYHNYFFNSWHSFWAL